MVQKEPFRCIQSHEDYYRMLENLGNLGDFLGGIGVVVTLLYLAKQIRQNTRQLKLDADSAKTIAFEGTNSDISRWIQEIVSSRDVAELWVRGLNDIDQLDETDRLRFNYLGMQLLQAWQIVYRRAEQVENQAFGHLIYQREGPFVYRPAYQVLAYDIQT